MNKYIDKIIRIYTKSKVSDFAQEEFQTWLVDNKFSDEKEESLNLLWNQTENVPTKDTFISLALLKERTLAANKKRRKLTAWQYSAAMALIICVAAGYIFTNNTVSEPSFVEYFSPAGESEIITLPDGTIVHANSETVILYPENYGKETRTVYLTGEANFKVMKNDEIPFIVNTKAFSVKALGTEFNVSSYPEDSDAKTTLISGSIQVEEKDSKTNYTLQSGEQLSYNQQSKQASITEVDIHIVTAWERGELVFRDATIKDILNTLERKYAVSFQYRSNVFNDDKFNIRFKKNASLDEVMDILKVVADKFDYQRIGDSYYINSVK